jgi:RNA polymerase sigma-70 factor, ECF subfamily
MPADAELTSFDAFVDQHAAAVFRFAKSIAADTAAAEDALQETFLAAWRGAGTYRGEGSVRGWLFAIARNAVRRQYRHRVDEPDTVETLSELGEAAGWGSDETPETAALQNEQRAIFERALAGLRASDREILLLRDLEGLNGEETAAILGITLASMKTRLHRARLRLTASVRNEYART